MIELGKYLDLVLKTSQKIKLSNYIRSTCNLRNNLVKKKILTILSLIREEFIIGKWLLKMPTIMMLGLIYVI